MTPSGTFSIANLLRGHLAERILTTSLERGGYRVTRLGIEELFDEVKLLDRDHYLALDLPEHLRAIPDLLVADAGVTWAKLIEVKFRRSFSRDTADELFTTLTNQRLFWPQSYAVIIISEPFLPDSRFHQDYIRVISPGETELLKARRGVDVPEDERDAMHLVWQQLPMLTKLFRFRDFEYFGEQGKHRGRDFWGSLDFVTTAIRELRRI
jgi:hypothetical protein